MGIVCVSLRVIVSAGTPDLVRGMGYGWGLSCPVSVSRRPPCLASSAMPIGWHDSCLAKTEPLELTGWHDSCLAKTEPLEVGVVDSDGSVTLRLIVDGQD
jgi:hypothetical protein